MSNYTGNSIVDYLKSQNKPSSFGERAKLAKQQGISGYRGTAQQNTQLLESLRKPTKGDVKIQQVSKEVKLDEETLRGKISETQRKLKEANKTYAIAKKAGIKPGEEIPADIGRGDTREVLLDKISETESKIKTLQAIYDRAEKAGLKSDDEIPENLMEETTEENITAEDLERMKEELLTLIVDEVNKRKEERGDIDPFTWTDEDTAMVNAEFEELYEPYYKAQMATSQRGARESIEALGRVETQAVKRESRSLEEALTESRAAMASRGLAFSGIREKGEAKTQEVSKEEMERIRDVASKGRRDTLSGLESQIGTEATQGLYPQYQLAPEYEGVMPGVTGIPGAIPKEKSFALQQEMARRQSEARQKWMSDILMREEYS